MCRKSDNFNIFKYDSVPQIVARADMNSLGHESLFFSLSLCF